MAAGEDALPAHSMKGVHAVFDSPGLRDTAKTDGLIPREVDTRTKSEYDSRTLLPFLFAGRRWIGIEQPRMRLASAEQRHDKDDDARQPLQKSLHRHSLLASAAINQ